MGKIVSKNQPCPNCASSDAMQIYDNGTGFCFSCKSWIARPAGGSMNAQNIKVPSKIRLEDIKEFPILGIKSRGISKEVCEFYGVRVSYKEDGTPEAHYYPYGDAAYKVRKLPKDFTWVGHTKTLFGRDKFNGGGKRVIVTEGEIDALSVAQASWVKYSKFYPVVALPSASSVKLLIEERKWLRSFKEIIIVFDEDEAGDTAKQEAVNILGFDKVKITKLPLKDANEVLREKGANILMQHIYDAYEYSPKGIMTPEEIWREIEVEDTVTSVPYPACLGGLNIKLKGMRGGEIVLFTSGSGSGKTTILREIMLHVLETTDAMIGIASFEELPKEMLKKMAGMAMNRNLAEQEIPKEELRKGFEKYLYGGRVLLLDPAKIDSSKFSDVMDALEYLCLKGCKYLFFDHITLFTSEFSDGLQSLEATDRAMGALLRLVKKYNVWLGLVSHLRKVATGQKAFEEGELPSMDDIKGCLGYDTGVLLYNGRSKKVQDIVVGDLLMGDDDTPREVLQLKRGTQQLYRVTSQDSFVCNEDHILTLSYEDKLYDMQLKAFLKMPRQYQMKCKQHYSQGYALPSKSVEVYPFTIGASLYRNGADHIPEDYLYNSYKARWLLLVGILHEDCFYSHRYKSYFLYSEKERLIKDTVQLAKSLGIYGEIITPKGTIPHQAKIRVDPHVSALPMPLQYPISVEKLGVGDYYGFTLSGNGRFVLENHLITHNSGTIKQISFDIIGFARNASAENERERNYIKMRVLKSRFTGLTGTVPGAYYNFKTGRLEYSEDAISSEFSPPD
jgi:twinkle protein